MAPITSELKSKIKSILQSNGIADPVLDVLNKDTGLKGENFASQVEYITVTFEDPQKESLNLFAKIPTPNQTYNQMIQDWQLFQKESSFFMEYLPKARHYCKSLGQEELLNIYPKCYYGDDKLIVFENLVLERGYIMLEKTEKQDFITAKLALTNLAKHHAISHAIIEEHGGPQYFFLIFPHLKFEFFMHDSTRGLYSSSLDNSIDTVVKILEKCEGVDGRDEAIARFNSMKGKQFDEMLNSLKSSPGDFRVLNHGDYWNNNQMYLKDKVSNNVTHNIAIDFQAVRYASPSVDLGYYFFMSVKPKVRQEQLQQLLEIYLDALKVTASELGHPIDLTLEELLVDFSKHFQFGYWQGLDVVTGAGYDVLKDMDLGETDDVSEWVAKFNELIQRWMEDHPEECAKNIKDIIDYWMEYERLTHLE